MTRPSATACACSPPPTKASGASGASLQKSGQLDNTFFVFTSDEGYFYGEHGLSYERRLAYEESARIPLMIRYPAAHQAGQLRRQHGAQYRHRADAVAGGAAPSRWRRRRAARCSRCSRATPRTWRTSFLIERFSDKTFPRVADMGYQAVRTDRWKYIHYKELSGMDELYDLRADPYEMKNLIHDAASQPALAKRNRSCKSSCVETRVL